MISPEYMLVGEPNAGKTSFCVQLVKRMQRKLGDLELITAPNDLGLIAEPLKAMNEGRAPEHTERGIYGQLVLNIKDRRTGRAITLAWPDYGGEQILEITRDRIVPSAWIKRISSSSGWILLIRLNQYLEQDTLLQRPVADILMPSRPRKAKEPRRIDSADAAGGIGDPRNADTWPAQVRFIEFFQALLYVRVVETSSPLPPLFVVLSCWDELGFDEPREPEQIFKARMPLLYDFVRSKWNRLPPAFFGLSAQGRSLRKDEPDADYARRGPEHFGYIVKPDGTESNDLSLLVAEMMKTSTT